MGRGSSANLRIDVRGVSRSHARILLSSGSSASVVDLAAINGTYVNGKRIDAAQLREGDELHFGPNAVFRFTTYLVPDEGDRPMPGVPAELAEHLTVRELEVARQVSLGQSNAEVARALDVKPRTVATHLERIYAKLEIRSRAELLHRMFRVTPAGGATGEESR